MQFQDHLAKEGITSKWRKSPNFISMIGKNGDMVFWQRSDVDCAAEQP
jgi:hypothetical protein